MLLQVTEQSGAEGSVPYCSVTRNNMVNGVMPSFCAGLALNKLTSASVHVLACLPVTALLSSYASALNYRQSKIRGLADVDDIIAVDPNSGGALRRTLKLASERRYWRSHQNHRSRPGACSPRSKWCRHHLPPWSHSLGEFRLY